MQDFMSFFKRDFAKINWATEEELMERLENGEQIWDIGEMTPDYFKCVASMIFMQADSELIGGWGYNDLVPVIMLYSLEEMMVVSETAHEEFGHGKYCYEMLEDLGFDTHAWIKHHAPYHRWRLREGELLSSYARRPTEDGRVNIFYYSLLVLAPKGPKIYVPIDAVPGYKFASVGVLETILDHYDPLLTAIRFATFQFLQDRGAGVQLKDALTSSFGPWAEVNDRIMLEEEDHLKHGEKTLAELRREYPVLVDREIDLWLPRVIATFGKPESKFDDQLRKYRITSRTHEEKLRDFLDGNEGIHTANERSNMGLALPSTDEIIEMWRKGDFLKEI